MINGPCPHGAPEAYACCRCILAGLDAEIAEERARVMVRRAESFAASAKIAGWPNESIAAQIKPVKPEREPQ